MRLFTTLLWLFAIPAMAFAQSAKPNVLWIISDDLDMSLGCYGDSTARTPHIDALAASGLRFDKAYAQYPLCNPSRTSFLSGKRPDTTRVWDNQTAPRAYLGDNYVFLPEYFHNNGYFTGAAGKVAHFPKSLAWDDFSNPVEDPDDKVDIPDMLYGMAWFPSGLTDAETQDGKTARKVGELLKQKRGKPFFLAAGFHRPHTPCVAPKKYFDMHPLSGFRVRPQIPDDLLDIPRPAFFQKETLLTDTEWKMVLQSRAAAISFMDAQVGYLMHLLDSLDLRRNTIVVFQSDHGFLVGEHQDGCYKSTLFEPTTQVPLIVAVPGQTKGRKSEAIVELVDIYPTLADLCGLPAPGGMDGISFAPVLEKPDRPWKTAAFTQVHRLPHEGDSTPPEITVPLMGRGIRTSRYRFMDWGGFGKEAYDEVGDPNEFTNLVFQGGHPALDDSLSAKLKAGWKGALPGAPVTLPGKVSKLTVPKAASVSRFEYAHWRFEGEGLAPVDPSGKAIPARGER